MQYQTAMQAAGRSAGTIRVHLHYLHQLRKTHASPWRVTRADLRSLLACPTWSPETRKSARSVFRGFYRWAHGEGLIEEDPALALASIRVPRGVARPTPEHLVERLVRTCDERVAFMAMLAAYGGLRACEIAVVHALDLLAPDELLVHGKGGKLRAVPIADERLAWLLGRVEAWAFPNGLGSHLSPGHVSRLLSRAMPEGWTAHTLRHRCGTVAYAGTRDLLAVSELLGHADPNTTRRYIKMPGDAVRAAAAAAAAAKRPPRPPMVA